MQDTQNFGFTNSWDIEQCKRLWNDIVEMQKKGKVGHFVGSIVNIAEQAMPTGVQKYMIIDGQQRMTTRQTRSSHCVTRHQDLSVLKNQTRRFHRSCHF